MLVVPFYPVYVRAHDICAATLAIICQCTATPCCSVLCPLMPAARWLGGVDALTSDGDELRKSVEFATACGAYVTQVSRVLVDGLMLGLEHNRLRAGCSACLVIVPGTHCSPQPDIKSACSQMLTRDTHIILFCILHLQGLGAIAPQPDEADIEQFLSTIRDYPTPPREYFDIEAKV